METFSSNSGSPSTGYTFEGVPAQNPGNTYTFSNSESHSSSNGRSHSTSNSAVDSYSSSGSQSSSNSGCQPSRNNGSQLPTKNGSQCSSNSISESSSNSRGYSPSNMENQSISHTESQSISSASKGVHTQRPGNIQSSSNGGPQSSSVYVYDFYYPKFPLNTQSYANNNGQAHTRDGSYISSSAQSSSAVGGYGNIHPVSMFGNSQSPNINRNERFTGNSNWNLGSFLPGFSYIGNSNQGSRVHFGSNNPGFTGRFPGYSSSWSQSSSQSGSFSGLSSSSSSSSSSSGVIGGAEPCIIAPSTEFSIPDGLCRRNGRDC